jgi:hypothetical protein
MVFKRANAIIEPICSYPEKYAELLMLPIFNSL